MATWTNLPQANIEPEKPIRASDIWAIYQNILALAEGAEGAPKIQMSALQSKFWEVDYSTRYSASGTSFTAPSNCICYIYSVSTGSGSGSFSISVNGQAIQSMGSSTIAGAPATALSSTVILAKGAVLTLSKSATIYYYKLRDA